MQGGSIMMHVDYRDLTKDENFWRVEREITKQAQIQIQELKKIKPYDYFRLAPQSYDVRNNEGQDSETKPVKAITKVDLKPQTKKKVQEQDTVEVDDGIKFKNEGET